MVILASLLMLISMALSLCAAIVWIIRKLAKKPTKATNKVFMCSVLGVFVSFALLLNSPEVKTAEASKPSASDETSNVVEEVESKPSETLLPSTEETATDAPSSTEDGETKDSEADKAVSQAESDAEVIDYMEIYNDCKSDKDMAKKKYKGNRYIVTAEINDISSGGPFDKGGTRLVLKPLQDGEGVEGVIFNVFFKKAQEESLAGIAVGHTITFEGTSKGEYNLYDCKLLDVADAPLEFLDAFTKYGYSVEQIEAMKETLTNVGITNVFSLEIKPVVSGLQTIRGITYKDGGIGSGGKEVQVRFNLDNGVVYFVHIYCPSYHTSNQPTYLSGLTDRRAALYDDAEGGYLKKIDWENKAVVDYYDE